MQSTEGEKLAWRRHQQGAGSSDSREIRGRQAGTGEEASADRTMELPGAKAVSSRPHALACSGEALAGSRIDG